MKLHIDNPDGFNEMFKTQLVNVEENWFEISLSDTGCSSWSDFWEICGSTAACRSFSVLTEEQYSQAIEDNK